MTIPTAADKLNRTTIALMLVLGAALSAACPAAAAQESVPDSNLVRRALSAELQNAPNGQHLMRYRLRKASPRLTTTKEILETRDGSVARLIAVNDKPLSPADELKEQNRLATLLADPGKQRSRKQSQDADMARVLKVLRLLPDAFLYTYAGTGSGPTGRIERFAFRPNPQFSPPDLESKVLTAMVGEIWIDPAQERVTHLQGHLERDVDYGWGLFGRLYKGGWIAIDQTDVGARQWRIVRLQMAMNGRVVFSNKSFETLEEESHFAPLPPGLGYAQAIEMVRDVPLHPDSSSH